MQPVNSNEFDTDETGTKVARLMNSEKKKIHKHFNTLKMTISLLYFFFAWKQKGKKTDLLLFIGIKAMIVMAVA